MSPSIKVERIWCVRSTVMTTAIAMGLLSGSLGCSGDRTASPPQTMSILVGSEPTLVISGFSPAAEDAFGDPRGVRWLADGSVVCLDGSLKKIGVWDSTGVLRWAAGRKGSGPGEFQEPQIIGTVGADSIFVYDASLRRLSLWLVGRGLVSEWPAPQGVAGNVQPFGVIGGSVIARVLRFTMPAPPDRLVSSVATIIAWKLDQRRVDTLTTIPNGVNNVDGYRYYAWRSVAAVTDTSIIFGRGDSTTLHEIDLRGRELRSFGWEAPLRLVTDEERESIRRFGATSGALATQIDDDDMADTVPQFGRLIRDPEGVVWIPAYEEVSKFTDTAVGINASGGTIGPFTLPQRFRATFVRDSAVLGVLETEEGARVVASFTVQRRAVSAAGGQASKH
jgi:hypothetical protein